MAYRTFKEKVRAILHNYHNDAARLIEAIDQKIVEDMKEKIQTS